MKYIGKNVLVKNCSVSWGADENMSISTGNYASDSEVNVTVANCIISEPLHFPTGYTGSDGRARGVYVGVGENVAIVDSVISHGKDRNPLVQVNQSDATSGTSLVFVNKILFST